MKYLHIYVGHKEPYHWMRNLEDIKSVKTKCNKDGSMTTVTVKLRDKTKQIFVFSSLQRAIQGVVVSQEVTH